MLLEGEVSCSEPKQSFNGTVQNATVFGNRIVVCNRILNELMAIGHLQQLSGSVYMIMHQQIFLDALKANNITEIENKVLAISVSGSLQASMKLDTNIPSPTYGLVMNVHQINHVQVLQDLTPAILSFAYITPNPNITSQTDVDTTADLSTEEVLFFHAAHLCENNTEQDGAKETYPQEEVEEKVDGNKVADDQLIGEGITDGKEIPFESSPKQTGSQSPSVRALKERRTTRSSSVESMSHDQAILQEKSVESDKTLPLSQEDSDSKVLKNQIQEKDAVEAIEEQPVFKKKKKEKEKPKPIRKSLRIASKKTTTIN
ncbi:hypothetical protein A0J61_08658 [Choanephora cucurbitarum]|uniref:Uncharacterized protein n=1 Tax=Choanephora cucurbitarum TaxID=101091 RepID=A0A1C7N2R7_9FUNG|nr:hypothetical protein A0J61_08658 [Choanephora cucurbitarum]